MTVPPEHEITTPVDLCLPSGRLNRAAIGFTRRQLHNTDGIGRGAYAWGRNKRWEYWAITTPTHIVSLTVSALDYAALHQVWVLDRATLTEIDAVAISPFSGSVTLPGTFASGPARARTKKVSIDIEEVDGGTRIRATTARVRLDVVATRPPGHEAMGAAVPWTNRLFQYTVKDVDRPAHGSLTVDGVEYAVPEGECWAVLDHGRGRWPYSVHWQWGAAAGLAGGHRIGVQLGGEWTPDDGPTENSLNYDGRVNKIPGQLRWQFDTSDWLAPWHITGERVDLVFTPFHDHASTTDFGIIRSVGHQCFGHYSGWMADDAGTRVAIDGLLGWAEDVRNRW
ncbi:DUF2804 domain-containing protein [Humibacter antri]